MYCRQHDAQDAVDQVRAGHVPGHHLLYNFMYVYIYIYVYT